MKASTLKEALHASGLRARVAYDEPMRSHTSLRIGGPVDALVAPDDMESLSGAMRLGREYGAYVMPLGGGTNILVRDSGIRGMALSLGAFTGIAAESEDGSMVHLNVGAGERLQELVAFCRAKGFSGIGSLAGIPGTVGGAIAGNAGSFGSAISDVVMDITIVRADGEVMAIERGGLEFAYRRLALPEGGIVVSARLALMRSTAEEVGRKVDECMRKKRETQPIGRWSAGCVYKNPAGDAAGRLIEEAGCKGMREGGMEVSRLHANFFVNTGEGTAEEFLRLMERVEARVREAFGMALEPEIKVVGS